MHPPTFLGITKVWRVALVVGLGALGLALGWFLPQIARWALDLPWVPFDGPLRLLEQLLTSIAEPWPQVAAAAIGLLAGSAFGGFAIYESLAITVTDQQVDLWIKGTTRTFSRAQIGAVFLDEKRLVLNDPAGRELARDKPEVSATAVAAGFRDHGYPWADGDPHLNSYRLWVPALPDLPPGADALLSARARALEKKRQDEATELRRELARVGVVVRDQGSRQYWRPTPVS